MGSGGHRKGIDMSSDDLRNIQAEVKEWNDRNFPDRKSYQMILGAVEEIGELAHAFLKREQGIRLEENHSENIEDAIGDIVIFLMAFCADEGLDLKEILVRIWRQVKERNWNDGLDTGKEGRK